MFPAMTRFKIAAGREAEFIADRTRPEAFVKTRANAGRSARERYPGGQQREFFEAIL